MPDLNPPPKITIEDLLRLKRAERPGTEFWGNFERELRQKQLAALLEKRPWWHQFPQLLVRRAYIPVGATAILAFTLVSVRYYMPSQVAQVESPAVHGSGVGQVSVATANRELAVPVSSPLVNRLEAPAPVEVATHSEAASVRNQPTSDETVELMPLLLAPREAETPSSRSIAANLARLEQAEPELANAVLGGRLSSPARVQTASLGELASVAANASKRNRLLAQYNDRPLNPEPTAPDIVRERLVRRLGDSEISDRISRLGLRGDQVSLRF